MVARRSVALIGVACALVLAGCTGGGRVEDLESRLAEVTAEKEALELLTVLDGTRREATEMTLAGIELILDAPELYGSPCDVAAALASYGTDDATWISEGLVETSLEDGWRATLFGNGTAHLRVVRRWVADDGRSSGMQWTWRGVDGAGMRVELTGVTLNAHDDEGRITETLVSFPWTAAYVNYLLTSPGAATTATDGPSPASDEKG